MSNKKCPNCGYELDSWNDCVSVNNILECPECEEHFELKAVRLNKPQLMIPKSIADWLDKAFEIYSIIEIMQIIRNFSKRNDIEEWFMHYSIDRLNLALAYLAGKELGVDLVKVGEG
ncbi:hypothetical protein EFL44_10755 [Lactococcus cremoris]|uniref:ORF23 n=1 Tax=Lactococcus phage TP901-1 TaxID=35345 RepID=UPI000009B5AB|nr:hypothetical protein [Lactococcus cremoris]NP_112686.1 ORF23 [Lactococcus phage TP901-1]AAK38040.1 ORF23 [Lactococcus phage TP901-1]MCT0467524.1 hypothetical protein [Lactococcus cremoris]